VARLPGRNLASADRFDGGARRFQVTCCRTSADPAYRVVRPRLLAKDRMQDFRELADDAFADLLRKHGRPVDLKTALRQSVPRFLVLATYHPA
jgi:hypothetical protein